eukprot:UN04477
MDGISLGESEVGLVDGCEVGISLEGADEGNEVGSENDGDLDGREVGMSDGCVVGNFEGVEVGGKDHSVTHVIVKASLPNNPELGQSLSVDSSIISLEENTHDPNS